MADETPETAPRRALKQKRRWWIPVIIVLAVLLAAGGGIGLYAWSLSKNFGDNLNRGGDVTLPEPTFTLPSTTPKPGVKPPVNFVLMGVDKREGDVGRSDSLMIAHLSGDRKSAYLISFPRDMWVPLPGRGHDKINAAYAYGGTALTVQTLQELLTVKIDHVAMIDMEGFLALTDAVGGITIDNPDGFTINGERFDEGELELEGERALLFVRARKQLPNGDLDRARNQRLVLQGIISKGLSPGMIANPSAFGDFISKVAGTMTVDDGLTDAVIRDLVLSLRLGPDEVLQMQAPIKGFGTAPTGASIDVIDEARLAELGKAIREDTVDEYYERYENE